MGNENIRKTAVIGAGIMGHGLAQLFATNGYDVTLIDHKTSNLEWSKCQMLANLKLLNEEKFIDVKPQDVIESINYTTNQGDGVMHADLILETVPEDIKLKTNIFLKLDAQSTKRSILASNTSGLSITEISSATKRPDKVVGCHWWNPPYIMPLVELIPGDKTSMETMDKIRRFIESLGKETIILRKEIPGFLWNRIQVAIMREALYLLSEGVASPTDIDKVIEKGYALRSAVIGPLKTIDLSGLKLWRTVISNLTPALSNDLKHNTLLDQKIERGELGAESGRGFYDYAEQTLQEVTRRRDKSLIKIIKVAEHSNLNQFKSSS